MRKLLAVFFACVFFAASVHSVYSQDIKFADTYPQYLGKLDTYRQKYASFTEARDFYTKSPTLTLKEKVRTATFELLVARDDLIGTYLEALRTFLHETPDHPGYEKGNILSSLVGERDWYFRHKDVYDVERDTLETLFSKGQESKIEYDTISTPFVYETLSTISFSKYIDLKIRHETLYKTAKAEVESLDGSRRTLFDRWIADIDNEFVAITTIENKAQEIRKDFKDKNKRKDSKSVYNEFIKNLETGKDSFGRLNGFLEEVITALNSN